MKKTSLTLINLCLSMLIFGQALEINIDDYTAVPGESFCLEFKVDNFNEIVSSQYTIQWDPAVMTFDSLINNGLPNPNNLFYNTAFINMGKLLINWFDSFGGGNDLPDGAVIYEICFTAIGQVGTSTTIQFVNLPLQIEVTSASSNGMHIGLESFGGTVSIVAPLELLDLSLTQPDCNLPDVGSIEISLQGGMQPYDYSWSGPGSFSADTEDIYDLSSGVYHLTVTDGSMPPIFYIDSFEVDNSLDIPVVVIADPETLTCSDTLLILDATSSSDGGDYDIFWLSPDGNIVSNANTLTPVVDAPGEYQLTIVNEINGCSSSETVTVTENIEMPVANAGGNYHIDCNNLIITLDGSASTNGPAYSAFWTSPDGNILSGENALLADVNGSGTYTLTVIDDSNGCTATDETMVSIDTLSPTANAGMDQVQLCFDTQLSLNGGASSTGMEFNYQWITANGNIVEGVDGLNPQVNTPGVYTLIVTNTENGCTSTDFTIIEQNEDLELADVGIDQNICEDFFQLNANLPENNTGLWSFPGSVQLENPTQNITLASELQSGNNAFIWTLSTTECPEYTSDTIVVTVESTPGANSDNFVIPFGDNPVQLDIIANDDISSTSTYSLGISLPPAEGTATIGSENQIEFSYPFNYVGVLEFEYELCNELCPDLCDVAVVSLDIQDRITIDSTVSIPNGFTPNDDGVNDTFVFPVLEENPSEYPDNEIVIFNRWGDVIYQAKPYLNDWTGTNSSGNDLPQGTYYYVLRLNLAQGEIIKGDVTILR